MNSKITVIPFGGLGNRLRVLNSVNFLAQKNKSKIEIVWLKKTELFAPLNTLYKSLGFDFKQTSRLKYWFFLKFIKHIYINKYESFYRKLLGLFYDKVLFDSDVLNKTDDEIESLLTGKKNIFLATCYQFYSFPDFNNFNLTDKLQFQIDRIHLPNKCIGIHIRRTDHSDIINESPIQVYISKIEEELKKESSSKFFLATDDPEVKKYLLQKYPSQIISKEIPLNRNTETGIHSAIIDIYCLAKCLKIIYNPKSSFAVMAEKIGNQKELISVIE